MRICLVSSNLHSVPPPTYGGVEGQMALHASGLAGLGHEVHVLTVGGSPAPDDRLPGVSLHSLGASFEGSGQRGVTELVRSQLAFARAARERIDALAPDVVHWHSRYPCLVGGRGAAKRRSWASIYHAHNWKRAENMRYPGWNLRRVAAAFGAQADKRIAQATDHVIGVSRFVRSRVLSESNLPSDRVSVLTNLIDPERFAPCWSSDSASGAEDSGCEILFVGRLAAEKGVETLIRALPKVLHEVPEAVLSIVGPSSDGTERGGYAAHCRALAQELDLGDHVRFLGEIPNAELAARLQRARVLAVPSVWGEPCGVVVIEGLACGVPVVASRVGGIPELIEEGVTGRLCHPGHVATWSRVLTEALQDDELRSRSRVAGPERIASSHTWERVGPELVDRYERTIEAHSSRSRPVAAPAPPELASSTGGPAPLKMLFVLTSTAGGAGEQAYQLAREISRDEFDMTVAFGTGYPLDDSFDRLGIAVRRLSFSRRLAPLANVRGLLQLYQLMRRESFEIVCTSCSIAGFFGRIAAAATGVPARVHVIQVYASRDNQPALKQWIYRQIERALDRVTTHYVAVSGAVESFGVESGIMPAEKVEVIYNAAERRPVAATARATVRRDLDIPGDAQVVGTLGRYEPQKGLVYFLRAAARVHAALPLTHFLVVGDGPLRSELEALASELGIAEFVHFSGWRADVPELLAAMDVFCLASLWETFGIAIAEAMLAGLPIVASRVDGIPEVVADGETGFLVPPKDAMGLAERLLQLLQDPELAETMGAAGRVRAETRFSVPTMVAEYERFFRRVAGPEKH